MTYCEARTLRMLQDFEAASVIDLSPKIHNDMPVWKSHPRPSIEISRTHDEHQYYAQTLSLCEHTGAHVDAPAHSAKIMLNHTVDKWPAQHLIRRAVKIDLSELNLGAGDRASAEDLRSFAPPSIYDLAADHLVIIHFGWLRSFRASAWSRQYFEDNSPGLDDDAITWLSSLNPRAIGSDTLSIETALRNGVRTSSGDGHGVWSSLGIALIENLDNLWLTPNVFLFIAIPLNIQDGSGSPIRPVAVW